MRKYNWKKILIGTAWLLAGIGTIVLLGAAIQKKNRKTCTDIKVEITGVERHMFIDEKDVLQIIKGAGGATGTQTAALDLRRMESVVERNPWVRRAEMYLDNNQVLQVRIEERQPVARVFTLNGNSFYLDSGSLRLPLSEKLSARVPVFTGFPSDQPRLAKPDSMLLHDIVKIGTYVLADSFWMAQVAQINITTKADFEMIPVIGDHIVVLGNADGLEKKFKRLNAFYQQAWLQNGINTYEKLDVQYNNQVVAVKKGTGKAQADSALAYEQLQDFWAQQKAMTDSLENGNGTTAKTVPATTKDSITVIKTAVPVKVTTKPAVKIKSPLVPNNKANKKPLTKVVKTRPGKVVKKKAAGKVAKPKAVMINK